MNSDENSDVHDAPGLEARSMHEGIETWEDCCVCAPEPRWRQLAEELEGEKQASESAGTDEQPTAPTPQDETITQPREQPSPPASQ